MISTLETSQKDGAASATRERVPGGVAFLKPYGLDRGHDGIAYLPFMKAIGDALQPRSYLEIGTNTGDSVLQFQCDALCIDPSFKIARNVIQNRRQAFFFQMRSDDFFRDFSPLHFLPQGIDLVFLDGLHHFEATLRDFINIEKYCCSRSTILIHDCLPTTVPMTDRTYNYDLWTGDVCLLLLIFKKYRPDLRVALFDCPHTGLVSCTALDPTNTTLQDKYYEILDEFMNVKLDLEVLKGMGQIYPYFDTKKIMGTSNCGFRVKPATDSEMKPAGVPI